MDFQDTEIIAISKSAVTEVNQFDFLPALFGKLMVHGEGYIFNLMRRMCPTYVGGQWKYFDLSNGARYMAPPDRDGELLQFKNDGNYFEDNISADAAGVIVTLIGLSHLGSSVHEHDEVLANELFENFHKLRDYALQHPESSAIFRAID